MGKVTVDTDVLIEYLRKNEDVARFLIEDVMFENICITYITQVELMKGATDKQSLRIIEKVIADFPVLYHTKTSSEKTVSLIKHYHLSHNLKLPDASIAAICIHAGTPLLTLNTKDFKFIKELNLIPHKIKPKSNWF